MTDIKSLETSQKILVLVGFFIIIVISSIFTFSFSVFVMQLLLGLITIPLILRKDYKTSKLYLFMFFISILFVFLIYFANQSYYGQPYYMGGSDDLKFEQWGFDVYYANMSLPHKVMESGIIGRYHNSPFYVVFIAWLIRFSKLFGDYSTFLPRFMNVYFLIWICMILEYLFKRYTNISRKIIMFAIAGFSFMPNIQYINAHIFRDTLNLLQVLLIILLCERLVNCKNLLLKISSMALLLILIYVTYYTRANSLAFAGIIIILMIGDRFKIKKRYLIALLFPLLIASDLLEVLRLRYFIETYSRYVSNIAGDGLSRYVFGQPLLPLGVFFRAFYAFITPFPNIFGLFKEPTKILFDLVLLLIYLGVLVQILAIPFIIKRIIKFDWLSLSFLSWFLAVIITTFTFRHVILYYPFMAAVAVDGYLDTTLNNRKIILFLSGFSAFCFGLIYVALKLF